ncbi:NRT1/ PTR family protein 6.4 [Tanacetum coccineum]
MMKLPPCNDSGKCIEANTSQQVMLYISLYTVELGGGGIKSNVSAFGSDQFDKSDPKEEKAMIYSINKFFFYVSLGSLSQRLSIILFRPVATTPSRFFCTNSFRQDNLAVECNLELDDGCKSDKIRYLYRNAYLPRLPATSNLNRQLHLMEKCIYNNIYAPWWDVSEDDKALYLFRYMSHNVEKCVDQLPYGLMNVYGCVRVYRTPGAIQVTVGNKGSDPAPGRYPGYFVKIYLPLMTFSKVSDIEMDVKNEVLKITIPKEKGKWIPKINIKLFFVLPEEVDVLIPELREYDIELKKYIFP